MAGFRAGSGAAGRKLRAWPGSLRGRGRADPSQSRDGRRGEPGIGAMEAWDERTVRERLRRAGQEHLLRFYADLAPEPRAALLAELGPLEPDALREHCRRAAAAHGRPSGPGPDLAARLQPLPPERLGSATRCHPDTRRRWEEEGRLLEEAASPCAGSRPASGPNSPQGPAEQLDLRDQMRGRVWWRCGGPQGHLQPGDGERGLRPCFLPLG